MEPFDLTGVKEYASEIAQPSEPPVSGNFSRIFLPATVVTDGDATTFAPYVRITSLRYGFCSYETFTMNTSSFSP